jgi:hypothetical protein
MALRIVMNENTEIDIGPIKINIGKIGHGARVGTKGIEVIITAPKEMKIIRSNYKGPCSFYSGSQPAEPVEK